MRERTSAPSCSSTAGVGGVLTDRDLTVSVLADGRDPSDRASTTRRARRHRAPDMDIAQALADGRARIRASVLEGGAIIRDRHAR
jgi:hypothetical protein